MQKFWKKVDKTEDCWLWTGYTDQDGYGIAHLHRKNQKAHRMAWQLMIGEIPEGTQLHHACHTPNCVNPAHLEPVMPSVHAKRHSDTKTHCKNGHEYSENSFYYVENLATGNRGRRCRVCNREWQAGWRKANPELHKRTWQWQNKRRAAVAREARR